jgi:hypothetical protein
MTLISYKDKTVPVTGADPGRKTRLGASNAGGLRKGFQAF